MVSGLKFSIFRCICNDVVNLLSCVKGEKFR